MKSLYLIFPLFLIFSCQQNPQSNKTINDDHKIIDSLPKDNLNIRNQIDSSKVKEWLTTTILNFFQNENQDMQQITTAEYYEFKMDAMNVDMGSQGSLSEQEFIKKWGNKYNLQLHPIQTGFLISGQDWGKISLKDISVKKINQSQNSIVYRLIIRDDEFQVDYDRDITVVQNNGQNLISDVLEYD
ncbi:hypothetical protein [Sphingobacterium bovistauri]|uniref:Beta-lactamase-inhibitor-like, PepSY-like n=1 Tax=Sphingobacterium bovistauri TaxID=2781959 RepID=A0ABS7Z3Q5_9SPHI|nr:hypothetical protein [Sphingobacterium bovistauri]MCA5004806.1 hypothetical protein [Sphingobacterium bovistauri]